MASSHAQMSYFQPENVNARLAKILANPSYSNAHCVSHEVHSLICRGANVNFVTPEGDTFIHIAMKTIYQRDYNNHENEILISVRKLIDAGADPLALDKAGKSPWFYAVKTQSWLAGEFITTILSILQWDNKNRFVAERKDLLQKEYYEVLAQNNHFLVINTLERLVNTLLRLNNAPQPGNRLCSKM